VTALALAAATAGALAVPIQAQAASAAVLYVDNRSATCNDSGTGTALAPYCSIQAAADAATAGDTVLIAGGMNNAYRQDVTVAHSGTAAAPITFDVTGFSRYVLYGGLTVSGSYVTVADGNIGGLDGAVNVTGSHVALNKDDFSGETATQIAVAANVSGTSVERSIFDTLGLGKGDSGTVVADNVIGDHSTASNPGVAVAGDSNTAIAGNTIQGQCGAHGIAVTGSSTTSIENNALATEANDCVGAASGLILVDAASAGSTTEGYNVLSTSGGSMAPYSWSGTAYTTQAAFAAASGQGTSDIVQSTVDETNDSISSYAAESASANPGAPGELSTDFYGNAWAGSVPDRGAVAIEDFTGATLSESLDTPQEASISLALQGVAWGSSTAASVSWGDGSTDEDMAGTGSVGIFSDLEDFHLYANRGTYTVTVTLTDATQTITRTTTVTTDGSTYVPVTPSRVLDTRKGIGAPKAMIPAGGSLAVDVTNGVTVPANMGTITAVVMNVTVTNPVTGGYATAYPSGTARPTTSNLNFSAGETVPNLVTVEVGSGKLVTLYNGSGGNTDFVADVEGYYVASSTGSTYLPNTPQRILDTRKGIGAPEAAVASGGAVTLSVPDCTSGTGANAVSAPATAVAVNVTVVAPTSAGYVTAYPAGGTAPIASTVNFTANETVPNLAVVTVGENGQFVIHNSSPGTVQLVADLEGCYSATLGDAFVPITPYRALDSRTGLGQESVQGWVAQSDSTVAWWTQDAPIVPDDDQSGPTAVVMNVTVTQPQTAGVIIAYPTSAGRPEASNLNFTAKETVPNLVMVEAGTDFGLSLYNYSPGTAQLVADYYGYFA
jgi:hypothetical protein